MSHIIDIGSRLHCSICKRQKRHASMIVIERKAFCGFCVNELAKASGRDPARASAAVWLMCAKYFEVGPDGYYVPKCAPEQMELAAAAIEEFTTIMLSLP